MVGKTAVGVGIDDFEQRVTTALPPLWPWPEDVTHRRTDDSIEWEFTADPHNRRVYVRFDDDTVTVEGLAAGVVAYSVLLRGVPVEGTVALTVALLVRLWEVTA